MRTDSFGARLRAATRVLSSIGLLGALAVSLLRFVDFDQRILLGLVAIAPAAFAAIALIFAATFGLREAAGAMLAITIFVVLWMPGTVIPRTECDVMGGGNAPSVVVMSHNTLVGNTNAVAIAAQVNQVKPDVLLLQETTTAFRRVISVELAEEYPYRQSHQLQTIFSKWPLSDVFVAGNSPTGGALIATVERPAARLRVANVHASAPTDPIRRQSQREEFAAMSSWRIEQEVDLMMGDFNASGSHVIYRNVVSDGYVDAHREAGCGLGATWTLRPAEGPAVLQLDHALVGERWDPIAFEVLDYANSDHKAIAVSIGRSESS